MATPILDAEDAARCKRLASIPQDQFHDYYARARDSCSDAGVDVPSHAAEFYFFGAAACGSSPISDNRRTAAQMDMVRDAILAVLMADQPMTVRQLFYAMVSRGMINKTEGEYKRTVCRLVRDMRLDADIPFGWIADNTRWMRKPRTHKSLSAALELTAQTYRRALWDEQNAYVEIWLEKDALAGVLYDATALWDVPLMVTRGYPSLTYVHEAAEAIAAEGKPTYLYYFGDHDPSGVDIPRHVEKQIRQFVSELEPDAEVNFERVAVTPEQIREWNLPTRPTKKSDTRAKDFVGDSVEVDAIPPGKLRELAEQCIAQHVDAELLERTEAIEQAERETLQNLVSNFQHGASA